MTQETQPGAPTTLSFVGTATITRGLRKETKSRVPLTVRILSPNDERIDFVVDIDARIALAFDRTSTEWLPLWAFGATDAGTVELIGFRVEWLGELSDAEDPLTERVIGVMREWKVPRASRALRSNELRVMGASGGMLKEARRRLRPYWHFAFGDENRFVDSPGRGPSKRSDRWYAEKAVRYAELIESGERSPRKALAGENHVNQSTVRGWIDTARKKGLWLTEGAGKRGQASPRAYELVEGED
ncbi:MAG: hypothetical protein F2754_10430 [Actinobacteria bacterium]|uniref:Unannotated protein n=1 Tax=freshwater metagenome TaxID=449393 RepID=A0A6J7ANJ1_9ZZZZ|nr:hypothetical protein [Actinomycetota bacterium]MSW92830.1 hypothetical protein [Actinomycetota bacterium]MSX87792.1 hypothetical protein [Actinomycetota bacterium]MSY72649.1 hypothetical protein [Actinomycetota bacterium]